MTEWMNERIMVRKKEEREEERRERRGWMCPYKLGVPFISNVITQGQKKGLEQPRSPRSEALTWTCYRGVCSPEENQGRKQRGILESGGEGLVLMITV